MVINAASPAATDPPQLPVAPSKVACSEVSLGSTSGSGDPAGRTSKATVADGPPSAGGLTTLTRLVAGDAVSAAVRNATNCCLLMNEVGLSCPFHLTCDLFDVPEMKLSPLIVIEVGPLPALMDCGMIELIVGGGTGALGVAVNT